MKMAFISDIHGNAVALEAVLANIQTKNIDKIYVLGDIAYRGPEPQRSIALVQSLETEVIKGNADEWIVRGVREGEVPDAALALMNEERDWSVSHLSEMDIRYLDNLKEEIHLDVEGTKIHAFHATPTSLFDIVLPGEADDVVQQKLMTIKDADIYIYAHIHRPYVKYIDGKTVINIGSVGLPFDGISKASYAIVDINEQHVSSTIERVPYNIEKVALQYEELAYPNQKMIEVIRQGRIPTDIAPN